MTARKKKNPWLKVGLIRTGQVKKGRAIGERAGATASTPRSHRSGVRASVTHNTASGFRSTPKAKPHPLAGSPNIQAVRKSNKPQRGTGWKVTRTASRTSGQRIAAAGRTRRKAK